MPRNTRLQPLLAGIQCSPPHFLPACLYWCVFGLSTGQASFVVVWRLLHYTTTRSHFWVLLLSIMVAVAAPGLQHCAAVTPHSITGAATLPGQP